MKNVFVKAAILFFCFALAVGAVLIFINKIVSPPEPPAADDTAYVQYLDDSLSDFQAKVKKSDSANEDFNIMIDRIELYKTDALIDDDKRDEYISATLEQYIPAFCEWCYGKFNASVWDAKDHEQMEAIIKQLRNYTIEHGTRAITKGDNEQLVAIEGIIQDYQDAWAAAKATNFVSKSDANSKMQRARQFAGQEYIKNCTALVTELGKVPQRLANSHFNHLGYLLSDLSDPSKYANMGQYDDRSAEIGRQISEFENMSYAKGYQAKVTELNKTKKGFDDAAIEYFNSLN